MKRIIIGIIGTLSIIFVGLVGMQKSARAVEGRSDTATEQWVNANHLRVKVGNTWQDVHMVPLADHLCESRHRLFKRYCN